MQTLLPHLSVIIRYEANRAGAPARFSTTAVTILLLAHTSCISLCSMLMECQLYHECRQLVLLPWVNTLNQHKHCDSLSIAKLAALLIVS